MVQLLCQLVRILQPRVRRRRPRPQHERHRRERHLHPLPTHRHRCPVSAAAAGGHHPSNEQGYPEVPGLERRGEPRLMGADFGARVVDLRG